MAGSPELKIFNPQGEYIGCVKHGEDAACLVSSYGEGAAIRYGHDKRNTVWTEGAEEFSAGESFDRCALLIEERIKAIWAKGRAAQETERNAAVAEPLRTIINSFSGGSGQ